MDRGFVYNAIIFRVRMKATNYSFPFFIRQIRKQDQDEFDGEVWGPESTVKYTGKSNQDVFDQITKAMDAKYPEQYTIEKNT